MIVIERITTENALVFKAIRLRALQDSPTAFSATYAKESQIPDEDWQKRSVRWSSEGSVGFLAFDGERPCGMVFCYAVEDDPRRGQIVSMWVDPKIRRAGAGKTLIDSVLDWAKAQGMREVRLMVTSVNDGAIAFYQRVGFSMTGKTGPYPNDPAITEYEMAMALQV